MSSFLNIRSSRPEVSCKKDISKILQNSWKHMHAAVFTLIKSQVKGLQDYWQETPAYVLS